MSVLIKEMEMPKSCWRCPLCLTVDPDTYRCMPTGKEFAATFDAIDKVVLPCPLVKIPSHGRLIDADALTDDLEFDVKNDQRVIEKLKKDLPDGFIDIRIATTQDDKDIKQNCIVLLREQPTIIEASEE